MSKKIAILGGSSQVASSVAMYLTEFGGEDVTAFIRSTYGDVFYKKLGINYQLLSDDLDKLKAQLLRFDIVVDFSIPRSEFWENHGLLKKHITNTMKSLSKNTTYILISTQNAFGFKDSDVYIKNRLTDWASPYCSLKRYGEKYANNLGKKLDIPVINLRLGQVHGFLQSVSNRFNNEVTTNKSLSIMGHPYDVVNTLFIGDIAYAITKVKEKLYGVGTYSVLSTPQWTQEQLYEYYKNWNENSEIKFSYMGYKPNTKLPSFLKGVIIGFAERNRGFIDVVILQNFPWLAFKAKGAHRVRTFLKNIYLTPTTKVFNLLGSPPMISIGDVSSGPKDVLIREKYLEEKWLLAIASTVNFQK